MTDEEEKENEVEMRELAPKEEGDFEFLDKKDEDQIIAEMRGDVISEYVYIFCRSHKDGKCTCPIKQKVVSLSYAGVKRLIHMRGNVETELVQMTDKEDEYLAIFKARDVEKNITVYGGAQQPKTSESSRYGAPALKKDHFALAKCITKAQRNAWRNLVPETSIVLMIKEKLDQEGVVLVSNRLSGKKPGETLKEGE